MAHVRIANTNRHANYDLKATPGYSRNGESMFTREATHPGYHPRQNDQISEGSRLDVLIRKKTIQVARYERHLEEAEADGDAAKFAQIRERLDKTRQFLARLRREQAGIS